MSICPSLANIQDVMKGSAVWLCPKQNVAAFDRFFIAVGLPCSERAHSLVWAERARTAIECLLASPAVPPFET